MHIDHSSSIPQFNIQSIMASSSSSSGLIISTTTTTTLSIASQSSITVAPSTKHVPFKIPRSATASSSTSLTREWPPILKQADVRHIYENKNIFFFGDSTIRSIYCDLSKLLHNGKQLSVEELKRHYCKHALYTSKYELLKRIVCFYFLPF